MTLVDPQLAFAVATAYVLPLYGFMVIAPRWGVTYSVMKSFRTFVPLALVYGLLLVQSWQPDSLSLLLPGSLSEGLSGGFRPQFLPRLEGIAALFSRSIQTAASMWVHLLTASLFLARHLYLEGLREGFPTALSLILCLFFGPLGFLLHGGIRFLWRALGPPQYG